MKSFILILIVALFPLTSYAISGKCGTCEYIQEQIVRIQRGLEPIPSSLIPEGYFKPYQQNQEITTQQVLGNFPDLSSTSIHSSRTDSDNNGLKECRYKIVFSDFLDFFSGLPLYTENQKECLAYDVEKAFNVYNNSLSFVGLEFKRVYDQSAHIIVTTGEGNFSGQASLFGAFGLDPADRIIFEVNSEADNFGANQYLIADETKNTAMDRPPGNPYVYTVTYDNLQKDYSVNYPQPDNISTIKTANFTAINDISIYSLALHEIGHLMGMEHTFEGLQNSVKNNASNYIVDWLSYSIGTSFDINSMPRSNFVGEENPFTMLASCAYNNDFMTYYDPINLFYPDLIPHHKAFIAHCYAQSNNSGAITLLNIAKAEYENYKVFWHSGIKQEIEYNDSPCFATEISIGDSVLGNISSWDPSSVSTWDQVYQAETNEDDSDYFKFTINNELLNKEIHFDIDYASSILSSKLTLFNSAHSKLKTSTDSAEWIDWRIQFFDFEEWLLNGDPGTFVEFALEDPYMIYTFTEVGDYYLKVDVNFSKVFHVDLWSDTATGDYFLITSGPAPTGIITLTPSTTKPPLNSTFTFSWNDITDTTEYILEESKTNDFSTIENTYKTTTGLSAFEILGKSVAENWYYRVKAKNNVGETSWSATSTIAVGNPIVPVPGDNKGDLASESDINGDPDGKITTNDIMAVVSLYGSVSGDSNFNQLGDLTSESDINGDPDNKITVNDIMAVVGKYGTTLQLLEKF